MERIETDIAPVTVEIDGAEYAVAERTAAVEEALMEARRKCEGRLEYRLWLAELEILLGRGAVKRLFCSGRKENLDRMQQIHAGVCRAFERRSDEIERQRVAERAEVWSEAAAALEPINELLRQIARAEGQSIYRDDVRREGAAWRTE